MPFPRCHLHAHAREILIEGKRILPRVPAVITRKASSGDVGGTIGSTVLLGDTVLRRALEMESLLRRDAKPMDEFRRRVEPHQAAAVTAAMALVVIGMETMSLCSRSHRGGSMG